MIFRPLSEAEATERANAPCSKCGQPMKREGQTSFETVLVGYKKFHTDCYIEPITELELLKEIRDRLIYMEDHTNDN